MLELLLKIHVGEFESLKKEQEGRRVTRDNLAYFTLLSLGGVLITVERTGQQLFLLGAWFVCLVLGWTRFANDMKIHSIRVYVRDVLAKKIREILSAHPDAEELLSGPHGTTVKALLEDLLAWESTSLNGKNWRRPIHLTAEMVLYILPAVTSPFLAADALAAVMGAGPTAVVIVGLLVTTAPLAFGIGAKSR